MLITIGEEAQAVACGAWAVSPPLIHTTKRNLQQKALQLSSENNGSFFSQIMQQSVVFNGLTRTACYLIV
jgi:hypothetical protein